MATDPTIQTTLDPEGKPLRLTHKHRRGGLCYRILLECRNWETGAAYLVICDDVGHAMSINKEQFYKDFDYLEGGC